MGRLEYWRVLTERNSDGILLTPKRCEAQTGANRIPSRLSVRFHCMRLLRRPRSTAALSLRSQTRIRLENFGRKNEKTNHPRTRQKKVMNEDLESFEINKSPDKELCDVWVWRLAVWKINWIFFVCLSSPPASKNESLSCLSTLSQQLYPQDGEQQLLCQLESANRNVRLKGQNCQTQLQFHLRLSRSK